MLDGQQVRNYCEAWTFPQAVAVCRVIDTAQINHFFKAQVSVVTQYAHCRRIVIRFHHDGDFAQCLRQALKLVAERIAQSGFKEFKFDRHLETSLSEQSCWYDGSCFATA
ncbi:hypothetical protein D3C81_1958070 [compost metagenome]